MTASIELLHGRKQDLVSKADRLLARFYRPQVRRLSLQKPVVCFSFDDIPDNAATNGAAILNAAGSRGSFFVAGGLCNRRFRQDVFASQELIAELAAQGHEIGCHTFSHADEQRLSVTELTAEYAQSRAFLSTIQPDLRFISHAYPYGSVGIRQKAIAARYFDVCRGVVPGVNAGRVDLMQLKAVPLYDSKYTADEIFAHINEAVAQNGWLIFYTHDVSEHPSAQGTSIDLFNRALDHALQMGCKVETMAETFSGLSQAEMGAAHKAA